MEDNGKTYCEASCIVDGSYDLLNKIDLNEITDEIKDKISENNKDLNASNEILLEFIEEQEARIKNLESLLQKQSDEYSTALNVLDEKQNTLDSYVNSLIESLMIAEKKIVYLQNFCYSFEKTFEGKNNIFMVLLGVIFRYTFLKERKK